MSESLISFVLYSNVNNVEYSATITERSETAGMADRGVLVARVKKKHFESSTPAAGEGFIFARVSRRHLIQSNAVPIW